MRGVLQKDRVGLVNVLFPSQLTDAAAVTSRSLKRLRVGSTSVTEQRDHEGRGPGDEYDAEQDQERPSEAAAQ
jgi:hypothetical protein